METVVRDRKSGRWYTGIVVRTEGRSVFVAWHGTFVADELDADQVEIWADAPDELRPWRGGIGVMAATGTLHVRDLMQRR